MTAKKNNDGEYYDADYIVLNIAGITYMNEPPIEAELCVACNLRPAVKTDSQSRAHCFHCALGITEPIIAEPRQGLNEKCDCGSGRKYKRCCRQTV